jgi:RHS repeat-associated protein
MMKPSLLRKNNEPVSQENNRSKSIQEVAMNTLSTISLRNFWAKTISLSGFTALLLLSALTCMAQQQRGTYPQGSYALSSIESINPVNGNLMFNIPLGALPTGRKGMSTGVGLYYNSKLYDSYLGEACYFDETNQYKCTPTEILKASPEGGWRLGFQYKLQVYWNPNLGCRNAFKVAMSFPDGSTHEFIPYGHEEIGGYYFISPDGYGFDSACHWNLLSSGTMTYYSTDGTYLKLEVQHDTNDGWENNSWTLSLPDGGKVKFNEPGANGLRMYDSNSNYIEVQNFILPNGNPVNKIVDQFNRSITIEVDPSQGTLVKVPGANGQTLTWTITGITILADGYPDYFEYFTNGQDGHTFTLTLPGMSGVDQIIVPSQAGGYAYTFDYNYPRSFQGFCEVKSVTLPSADQNKATASYTYTTSGFTPFISDVLENKVQQKTLKYLGQHDNPTTFDSPANYITETWTYAYADPCTGGANTITSPNGSVTTEWSYGRLAGGGPLYCAVGEVPWRMGLIYKSERPDGTVVERIWQTNTPQSPYLARDFNPYTKTEFVSIRNAAGALIKTAITDYKYDKNNNLTQRAEYDFVDYNTVSRDGAGRPTGIPAEALAALKRVTINTYNSPTPDASDRTTPTPYAYNRPGSPDVRMAIESSELRSGFGSGTALTRTEIFYDNALTTANPIQISAWDSFKSNVSRPITRPLTTTNSSSSYTQYDAYGNATLITDANNVQTKFDYDPIVAGDPSTANLYPTRIRKAYGTAVQLSSSLTYDFATGQTLTTTDDDNQVTNKATYDDLGRPTMAQEAFGTASERRVVTQYDDALRVSVTKSDLETVGDGKIVSVQHYDQLGRNRLSRKLENSATESATDETTGVKVQTRFISTSANTYKLVSNPYRGANSIAAAGENTMGWTRETMDRTGRVIEIESFDGSGLPAPWGANNNSMGKVTIAYDANYTTTTDQAGKVKRTRVNALAMLDRVDEPDSVNNLGSQGAPVQPTYYTYDALGRLTQVSQGVQTRSFIYSSLSRLLSSTNPEKNGADTYEYDANGNNTKHTDARGWYTVSTYDSLNRVTTVDYSNTPVNPDIKKFYDNPAAGKYGKGRYWKDYTGGDETTEQTVEYSGVDGYDIFGRPLSLTQKFKTGGMWSAAFTTLHTYDRSGNVKEKTLPSLRKITYSFDAVGRLSQMVGNIGDGVQRTYSAGIQYNPHGQLIREQFGTATPLYHRRHYNSRGQLFDVRLGTDGGAINDGPNPAQWTGASWNRGALRMFYSSNLIEYAWPAVAAQSNNGNLYRQDHFVPTALDGSGNVTSWVMSADYYCYDSLNRVAQTAEETYTSAGGYASNVFNQQYSYDRYGNRTVSGTLNLASPSFKYVAATNRQKAPTDSDTDSANDKMRYDQVGNLIRDIHTQGGADDRTYDINNQMLTAVGPNGLLNTYAYNAEGHRVRRSINNGQYNWWHVYGIGGELVAEYAAGANPNAPVKEYGYRQGELLIVGDVEANCAVRWLVTDQIGTPRMLAGTTGSLAEISRHDYLPYGEELTAGYGGRTTAQGYTGDCVRDKFVGYERDAETGLDYAEARYYGSAYGRFTSVDPAMGSARKSMPQSWNRYSYVLNRPLSLVDPTGEFWIYKANEELKFIRKGSPTEKERKKYEAEGYQVIEDNTIVNFGGGGTKEYFLLNGKRARLGDDGQIHIIYPADKLAPMILGIFWVAPVVGLVGSPVLPEVAPASSALSQLAGGIGVAITVSLPYITQVLTNDDPDDDKLLLYRSGSDTDNNLTPKEKDRDSGVSTFDTIERAALPGEKYQIIDPSRLVELEAFKDNPITGHHSIRPRNPAVREALMDEWIKSRESGTPHRLTIELRGAIVGSGKRPK